MFALVLFFSTSEKYKTTKNGALFNVLLPLGLLFFFFLVYLLFKFEPMNKDKNVEFNRHSKVNLGHQDVYK